MVLSEVLVTSLPVVIFVAMVAGLVFILMQCACRDRNTIIMGDDPIQLSLKLCKVLERIGVSENMRKMHRDTSIYTEIIWTITCKMTDIAVSRYRFGSSCEGTTTPGMGSDLDVVACYENLPVIQDIQDAPPGLALLMFTSRNTPLGYVKLQEVFDGIPITIHHDINDFCTQYDCEGRACRKHVTLVGRVKYIDERNGPADTIASDTSKAPIDIVTAFRSKTFSQFATDSLEKCIACAWVSRDDVERMKQFGVLLVGVGFPSSVDCDIQWRMSFSFQERELMFALNLTQHNCYVLLKLIKNLITAHPDVGKSLTSYHCKTCLFTVITNTSPALWTDTNLIQCMFICLTELTKWISDGNCPNFFINQNNMFDRHEFRQAQERLLHYMRDALREWPRLLYHIQSDHLGEALRGLAHTQIDEERTDHMCDVLFQTYGSMLGCQNTILEYCHTLPSYNHITQYLFRQVCDLPSVISITEHTQEQTQSALRLFKPFIHKLFALELASAMYHSTEDPESRQQLLDLIIHNLKQCKNCDAMSGKLSEATILYRIGNIEECRDVLEQIERQVMHCSVISKCKCYPGGTHYCDDDLNRNISIGYINQQNFVESSVAPCMKFLPSQSEIIPTALQYEMYRSVYASPDSRDEYGSKWYDFAVVDSKIYLYFMQYLVYSHFNQALAKREAVDQILKTLDRDPNLNHRETAYNLLGWIYIQEGQLQEAVACMCHSWQIRPDHNAVKWHIPALLLRLGFGGAE